ncbi:MAG: hypothetical protein ACP5GU_09965, partial [Thermoprotei archaeon]|jgi:hypothetical protein
VDTQVFTEVLRYTTWDNVGAKWYYPPGAKIRIQAQRRYYDMNCNPLNWEDFGYTEITLDNGIGASFYRTGRNLYTLKFEILYRLDYHEGDPLILSIFDTVYAIDTLTDPRNSPEYALHGMEYYLSEAVLGFIKVYKG